MKSHHLTRPWLRDFFRSLETPALLSREGFTARYLPQYARPYKPPQGIRMVADKSGRMHCAMSTPGSVKSQVTEREGRITEAFNAYLSDYQSVSAIHIR